MFFESSGNFAAPKMAVPIDIFDVVYVDAKQTVPLFYTLLNFISNEFSAGGLLANEHTGDGSSLKSAINEPLYSLAAFFLRFFPKRSVLKPGRRISQDNTTFPNDIHPKNIFLIVKAEKDSPCHKLVFLDFCPKMLTG